MRVDCLLNEIYYRGRKSFSRARVLAEPELFANRAALFYTQTKNLPDNSIGDGPLDLCLPALVPTQMEFFDHRFGHSPRLWVDLLQRASMRIRWRPIRKAVVELTRYDIATYGAENLLPKHLIDALKVSTTGRRDKKLLHYFGAIFDDSPKEMVEYSIKEELVNDPRLVRMRVIVRQKSDEGVASDAIDWLS